MRPTLPLLLFFLLTACGTRGPLSLPPGPAPDPLLGKPGKQQQPLPQTMPDPNLPR